MYKLTSNPDVLHCLETGAWIPRGHRDWPTDWLQYNTPQPEPSPYQPYSLEHFRAIRDAAATWMLEKAKERGYDSVESCVSYYNSTVERYRREARAMVAWRDDVYGQMEFFAINPPANIETWEQVRVMLPQPEAYDFPHDVQIILPPVEETVSL